MASIRDFAVTEYGAATIASLDCEMPEHVSGDLLIYFASKDGAVAINDPGGIWTNLQNGLTTGAAYRCGWTAATTSTHTLTLVTGTAENWTVVVLSIKNPHGTPISTSAVSAEDSTMPFAGPTGATTGSDTNCLILHAWVSDSGLSPTAYAPLINVYSGDNGANSTAVAYTYQRAAGAITDASWFGRGDDDGKGITVAIKDNGSETEIPPYSDSAISSGQVLRPLVGLSTMFSDVWTTSITITALGTDFDYVYLYEVLPSFTLETTDANSPAAADVTFPMHIGDCVYFGSSTTFASIAFIVSTAGATGVLAWEYGTGHDTWATATGFSGSLTATGGARVGFTREIIPTAWIQTEVNNVTTYWIRARITTAYVTNVPIISQARKDGHVCAYVVATASADSGTNPYTDSLNDAGASSTSNLAGCQIALGTVLDMDTGIIVGTTVSPLPSDFAKDIALPTKKPGGVQITFFDTNNNCLSYKVGAMGCKTLDPDNRNVYAIDWNGSATPWALAGTINKSAVTRLFFSSYGYFAAAAHRWSMLSLVSKIAIAGGTSGVTLDLEDIAYAANRCIGIFPFIRMSGSACTVYAPLQFGGGDPVRIFCNLNTFQFPHIYDGVDYFDWNAAVDVAGIKFYPKSGDVLKFTNCVFTSASSYRWEWDASSALSGWTGDFSGTSVVNAAVVLREVFTFDLMTFINCSSFTQNGAAISNSKFTNTKIMCDNPENLSHNSFVSSGTGHAIELTATAAGGTFTFHGNTFSGYAVTNGSTGNECVYNNSGGAVTINVTGGVASPTIMNGSGASTTVNNNIVLTLTGLITGSDISILSAGTTTELINVQGNVGTTYGYQFAAADAGDNIDVGVFKAGYIPYYTRMYTLPSADGSLPISQVMDRAYLE